MKSAPGASGNLSSAQRQVLIAVKRRGEASADEVAETLGVTPSAARQHLAGLKSGGLVASRRERGRSGRPADLYHGTELGEYLFAGPTAGEFSIELLGHIEEEDPELVPRVFERRRRQRVEQYRDTLAGKPLGEKVAGLAEILDAEGYMGDVDELPRQQLPTHAPQLRHLGGGLPLRSTCTTELELMQEVLPEAEVTRVAHKVAGAFPAYEIRPRAISRKAFDQKLCAT